MDKDAFNEFFFQAYFMAYALQSCLSITFSNLFLYTFPSFHAKCPTFSCVHSWAPGVGY